MVPNRSAKFLMYTYNYEGKQDLESETSSSFPIVRAIVAESLGVC